MSTEISYVPAPRNPSVVYALYDVHEMSRPQLMRGLMNVMQSMYFKALTKDFVTIIPVTDVRAVPPGSAVLVYSSTVARRFIGGSSMQNYRGSVYHADGLVYIIGVGIGGMRCLLISSPKDDAQEKMVVKMFYATASDIFKAYRFNRGDFEGYAMHTDDTLDYTLIREPQEWDAAKSFMESHASEILAISFDIETAGFPTFISAFGFTLVLGTLESPRFKSYTIAMGIHDYCWHHTAMRYICSHPAPKIAHNGAYDCTVLLRYRIPVANMLFDTMLMHHSIRCDALKSLAYVASTLLPDYVFWKGEIKGVENKGNEGTSETQLETETKDHGVPPTPEGRIVYYKYCAKDTYYTARICLEMMKLFHTTSWAVRNYCLVHFLQYRVGIFMGLAGMPIDKTKFNAFVKDICTEREQALSQLRTYAKDELFNPASTSEVQNFIYVTLGLPLPKGIRLKPEKELIQKCRKTNTWLLLDECFIEFCEGQDSMLSEIEKEDRLLLLRAFTKSFAIPGVRLGYLIGSAEELLIKIREQLPEWNLSVFSQKAGQACLSSENAGYLKETVRYVKKERQLLTDELQKMGIRVFPGEANFLLLYCEENLYEKLLQRGILIRDCSNFEGLSQGYYRIAVKRHEENRQLLEAIKECLKP